MVLTEKYGAGGFWSFDYGASALWHERKNRESSLGFIIHNDKLVILILKTFQLKYINEWEIELENVFLSFSMLGTLQTWSYPARIYKGKKQRPHTIYIYIQLQAKNWLTCRKFSPSCIVLLILTIFQNKSNLKKKKLFYI